MNLDDRDQLLVRYLDGDLTPAEMDALNALLKTDAAARASLAEMAMQAVSMVDLARMRELAAPKKTNAPRSSRTQVEEADSGRRRGGCPARGRGNGLAMARAGRAGHPGTGVGGRIVDDRGGPAPAWTTGRGHPA